MKCPFCGHDDTQVKDSRPSDDGGTIRRRRFCPACDSRFTTFERVQLRELIVIKSNGDRKTFERDKILASMAIALRKRPVDEDQIERSVNQIVRTLESHGENEVASAAIGQLVMESLRSLDQVAYIRYASVYRGFREAEDFGRFMEELNHKI